VEQQLSCRESPDVAETPDAVDLCLREDREHLVESGRKGAVGCGRRRGRVPRFLALVVLVLIRHRRGQRRPFSVVSANAGPASSAVLAEAAAQKVHAIIGSTGGVMPFKSQAQRRKFAQLLVDGKISDETFEEWNRETGSKKLPERVRSKSKVSTKPRARKSRAAPKKKKKK
jgi:hypothetical protein